MKGRPQEYMDVGIVQFMAFPEVMKGEGPVVDSIEALAKDDYFQVVEVTSVTDVETRRHAIDFLRRAGKRAAYGVQPVMLGGQLNLNDSDPSMRQRAVDVVRAQLAEAKEWDARGLAVMSGPDPGAEQRSYQTAMLCASLKEICELSRRIGGPPVLLENFDRVPFGKNCLIGPTVEAAAVARRVQPFYLDFGLMIDLSHLPLLGERPAEAVKAAGPWLRHVHIGNCVMRDENHPAYGDNHPPFGIPEGENGTDELAAFLKALLDAGYIAEGGHNVVSFEVKPFGGRTSDEIIEHSKRVLDEAWASL